MKKLFKFSLLALFVAFTACDDATDIVQESELNDDTAFATVGDLESGLRGVYANYGPDFGTNGDGDVFLFNDLFTDNLKRGLSSTGQGSQEASFLLAPGFDFPIRIWGNRYSTINFSNRVLNAIERLSPGFNDTQLVAANRIKGELLAMRALAHFDILQYFTPDYEDPNSPSAIIVDFVPEINEVYPRNTVSEVFAFVNNDLDQALALLEGNTTGAQGSQSLFFMRPDVVKAVQARVALFQGDYVRAEALVTELEADYNLSNVGEYTDLFEGDVVDESNEAIFILPRLIGNNTVGSLFTANTSDAGGNPFYEMSNQLYDLYANTDIRKTLFVDTTFPIGDGDNRVLVINKYPGNASGQLLNNIKLIRFSEMVLIKAEAQARTGNLAGAVASVNLIKTARLAGNTVTSYGSANEALADIMNERRKELCFEGHRYLDIKRIGKDIGVGIERDPRDCASFSAPCELPPTDYRFTVPIPITEVSANPTIQQNPGY